MKQGESNKLSYPNYSTGFNSGGIHSFDDLSHEIDIEAAQAVDSAIDGLNAIERTSIYVKWLGEKTLVNPIMIDTYYQVALSKLCKKLPEKNLH